MATGKRKVQLEYGLKNNRIINVHELSSEEKGKACNCVCPGCRKPLEARLGPNNQWHFAHDGAECNTASAQQTAIHILAKEIIEERKELLFPGISITRESVIDEVKDWRVKARIPPCLEFIKPSIIKCDSVILEKKLSTIVPDIIVSARGRDCLIEIAVSHFVDDNKKRIIEKIGLPLFEIDLSDLNNSNFSRTELTEAVLHDPNNRTWIYNPLYEQAKSWAKDEYDRFLADAAEAIKQEEIQEAIRSGKKKQQRLAAEKKIKSVFEPDNYRKEALSLENEKETAKLLSNLHMKIEVEKLPFFFNIPISGEMVFPCDRRIWQSALFDKFVFYRSSKEDNVPTVHLKKVEKWVTNYNKQFRIDWSMAYKTDVSLPDNEEKAVTLLKDVVDTYFNYLVYLGFLEPFICEEAVIRKTYSIVPPNSDHANKLIEALQKVDWYDPLVDKKVMQLLEPNKTNRIEDLSQGGTGIDMTIKSNEQRVQKTSWEERNTELDKQRSTGLSDIEGKEFEGDEPIYDRFNWRWLKCTNCHKLIRADQMASYGGRGSINKGICRECSKKR